MERHRRDRSNDWRHRLSDRKSINIFRIEKSMKIAILPTSTVRPQVIGSNFSVSERMEMYRSTLQLCRDNRARVSNRYGGEF